MPKFKNISGYILPLGCTSKCGEKIAESETETRLINMIAICALRLTNPAQPGFAAVPDHLLWNGRPLFPQNLREPLKVSSQVVFIKFVLEYATQTIIKWVEIWRVWGSFV